MTSWSRRSPTNSSISACTLDALCGSLPASIAVRACAPHLMRSGTNRRMNSGDEYHISVRHCTPSNRPLTRGQPGIGRRNDRRANGTGGRRRDSERDPHASPLDGRTRVRERGPNRGCAANPDRSEPHLSGTGNDSNLGGRGLVGRVRRTILSFLLVLTEPNAV